MGFLLSLKQSWHRSKVLSGFLLNLFEIELIMVLCLSQNLGILKGIKNSIFPNSEEVQKSIDEANELSIASLVMLILNIAFLGITLIQMYCEKSSIFYLKNLHLGTIQFIKIFPYFGIIPLVAYELRFLSNINLGNKILAVINLIFLIGWSEIEIISSWSYRFKEVDFCNSRHTRNLQFVLAILFLIVRENITEDYSALVFLLRALIKLFFVYELHDYKLVHKVELFYGLFGVYFFGIIFASSMWGIEMLSDPLLLASIVFFGVGICYFSLERILLRLGHYRIENISQLNLIEQTEPQMDNLSKKIQETENILRVLTNIFVEKEKYEEEPEHSEFPEWWQIYNRMIMVHRIQCVKITCVCRRSKLTPEEESNIYMLELLNLSQTLYHFNSKLDIPKLLFIYLLIEIAKKPLKAYYELIRFKQEKANTNRNTLVEMEYLMVETRECFAQVFTKNKAMNQELELMKVIEYEELMMSLENRINLLIGEIISFYEIFFSPTAKGSKIKEESLKINDKKIEIEKEFYNLLLNYSDSSNLDMMIVLFYNFIEIYRSKEGELRKLGSQINLRKRIYHKTDSNIFSPQYGSIYIDLVQERGKIINLTSNLCAAYGYSREEMVGYNVRRFMPAIYSKHHDKFLSNFVEKGKLKLLREKERIVFAKNKKKFIFPVNVRLKAEYLLENQFGSTSLINAVDTSSDYIMVSMNGKLEEISENLYRKLFNHIYRDEVGKCSRFSVFKLMPSLNKLHDPTEEPLQGRILEGLIITSSNEETLNEKFRWAKDVYTTTSASGYINSQSVPDGSKMSILSAVSSNSINFGEQNEIVDWLTETYRAFLVDLNILSLKGFKISYKVSNIHTSEFNLFLIEIVSIDTVESINFWRMLIEELKSAAEIYQLNEIHGPVAQHLNDLEQMIQGFSQNDLKRGSFIIPENVPKADFSNGLEEYGEVRRKREEYEKVAIAKLKENESEGSFLSMREEDKELAEVAYEASEQSSIVGNIEIESKRQILLTAFNSHENIISNNIAWLFNLLLLLLLIAIVILSVFTFTFVYENVEIWRDVKTLFIMEQVTANWIAIEEVETFSHHWEGSEPEWGSRLKSQSIQMMKNNLKELPILALNPVEFYTQEVNFDHPFENNTETTTLIKLLNRYFYMMSYQDHLNIEEMRIFRAQVKATLERIRNERVEHNNSSESYNSTRLILFVSAYVVLLLIIHIFVLGIYLYYRGEEDRITSLLSYMNRKEIKKETVKLRELKLIMKDKTHDNKSFDNLARLKEILNKRIPPEAENESNSPQKPLKLELENDKIGSSNSFGKTKLFFILLVIFVFLSNFTIVSFWANQECDKFFKVNIKAAELVFEFEKRVPVLLGSVLGNVNKILVKKSQAKFNQEGTDIEKLFLPASELSKPDSIDSPISGLVHRMFPSSLCQLMTCPKGEKEKGAVSFEYLVYEFYRKFSILLPNKDFEFDEKVIKEWVDAGNIEIMVNYLEQIIIFSNFINNEIDNYFLEESEFVKIILIVCCVLMIPLNILIILYAQRKFFSYLNYILSTSEELFMHFPVNVLTENTYLISYFSSKIKSNK